MFEFVSVINNVMDVYVFDDECFWIVNENGFEMKYEEWICRFSYRLISEFKLYMKSKNDF